MAVHCGRRFGTIVLALSLLGLACLILVRDRSHAFPSPSRSLDERVGHEIEELQHGEDAMQTLRRQRRLCLNQSSGGEEDRRLTSEEFDEIMKQVKGASISEWQAEKIAALKRQIEKLRTECAEGAPRVEAGKPHKPYSNEDHSQADSGKTSRQLTSEGKEGGKKYHKKKKRIKQPNVPWSWLSITVAIIFTCCCGLAQLACCFVCSCGFPDKTNSKSLSLFGEMDACFGMSLLGYLGSRGYSFAIQADLAKFCRREMRLMLLLPLIPLSAFQQTSCEGAPPTWVYYAYLPFLIRVKLIEMQLLKAQGCIGKVASLGFVLGILEHADAFTDGIFPIQAIKCDPEVTWLFTRSFQASWFPSVAPVIAWMHFAGLSATVLLLSILSQQALATTATGPPQPTVAALAADVAGMGALVGHLENQAGDPREGPALVKGFTFITKVLLENCLQLWVQASYFALVFARTSQTGRNKLLASLCLGMASATFKSMQGVYVACSLRAACWQAVVFCNIFAMLLITWAAAKVYFAFECDSHIWNLTTGCMAM